MPTSQDNPNEIFDTLGFDFKTEGAERIADCPFCGKHKFYLNEKRSVFDCKVCGASGNQHTILSEMAGKVYLREIQNPHYGRLASYRGLPEHAFRIDTNIGYDSIHSQIIWAVRKPDGRVQGLRTWKDPGAGKKAAVRNLKGCKLGLLGAEALSAKPKDTVYLCEGEWDRHAWLYLLDVLNEQGIVLAVPGANNFNAEWAEWLQGRDVVCLYDNDDAGRAGTGKVFKFLHSRAGRLRFIHWDSTKKDGYDTHDIVKENLDAPENALAYVNKHLSGKPTATDQKLEGVLKDADDRQSAQESVELVTVEQLHATFHKWLLLDSTDLLDIIMGVCWSINLPGNPLWMFIVAPPSGSKSETIIPISKWWKCAEVSNMTSKSLISGFQLSGNADPSLLASLEGKRAVIAIKDLTPLLQGGQEERDEVFGILRDAYDGSITKVFGNGLRRSYKALHFSVVAGVTPAIDAHGSTSMGERFLKFRSDRDVGRADEMERALRAVQNCGAETTMHEELKAACIGCLQRPFNEDSVAKPTHEFSQLAVRLAWCVAHIRGVAPTDKGTSNQAMAPLVEATPRLAIQFTKLAQGLALHFETRDLMDRKILHLLRRVALHTPDKVTTMVVQELFYANGPISLKALGAKLPALSSETINNVMMKLFRINIVTRSQDPVGTTYCLTPEARTVFRDAGIFDNIPHYDPFYRGQRKPIPQKRIVLRRPT